MDITPSSCLVPASPRALRREMWKPCLLAVAWPAFLLVLPWLHRQVGWWSVGFMLFPGAFIMNWMALLLHECWHQYLPAYNGFFYRSFSWMLLADPQIFHLIHPDHHSLVSTWGDLEVHPFGNIQNHSLKIVNNWLEIILGMVYILLAWHIVVPRHPRYRFYYRHWRLLVSGLAWSAFFGSVGYIVHRSWGLAPSEIVIPWAVTFWLGSLLLHHSTLMQHGNLIVEGSLQERNHWIRSLRADAGCLEKLFLMLTRQDQVLHHTMPWLYLRPFRNNLMHVPENAVLIGFRDYGRIVQDMLLGRDSSYQSLGLRTPVISDL